MIKTTFLNNSGLKQKLPAPVRPLATLCSMLLLCTGASTIANAGSYRVIYSGGKATSTQDYTYGASDVSDAPYQLSSDGWYGGGGTVGWGYVIEDEDGNIRSESSGTVVCKGEITATFTWEVGAGESIVSDPYPTKVVLREECDASIGSPPSSSSSGTSNNDLGFPFVSSGRRNAAGGSSKGVRYKIVDDPGPTFTVKCSPSANISGGGGVGGGSASARYRADVSPLEILLEGGIGYRNTKRYLIGQLVTGSVSDCGLTQSLWDWKVSGGKPFKDWNVVWPQGNSVPHTTSADVVELGTEIGPQVTFHFKEPTDDGTNAIVSTTVHLAISGGAKPSAGLDTTLTRTCSIDVPSSTFSAACGYTRFALAPAGTICGMEFGGYSYTTPEGDSNVTGTAWTGTVTTPGNYGSGGGWNVVQLGTLGRSYFYPDGKQQHAIYNGLLALDGYYPEPSNLYPDDGTRNGKYDHPMEYLNQTMDFLVVDDHFIDYLMYKPPGTGSCFVPLQNLTWYWKGRMTKDPNATATGGWSLSNTGGSWSPGTTYPAHPHWTAYVTDGLGYGTPY